MARIGTWRKTQQVGNDQYEYANVNGLYIKIYHPPTVTLRGGIILTGRDDWTVSIHGGRSYIPIQGRKSYQTEYLAGNGRSNETGCSKTRAFKLAREYMRLHPGKER